ncbi:MAG TPA: 3-hydroxyacyl-CoA dehydrogenase family protein [Acidimicrobiales bacterium]|nr:3-hydroxyacyl-CoA dehydrogenase family protein [Acidimicrobiales bacterium]
MTPASIGVIGAGVMGSGIAQSLATAGYRAVCYDISPEQLERARVETVSGRYGIDRGVDRGKLTAEQGERAKELLTFTSSFEEAAAHELVIEVVPEDLGLKVELLRRLDATAPPGAVLASNTSGFPIAGLAKATDRPDRVIGWHWASPPAVMRLAEIVVTAFTAPEVVETIVRLARECGKNPVVVQDTSMVWGFVPNRILAAMVAEAQRIVADGVCTAEQLDRLCMDCFNWPTGPFGIVGGAKTNWKDNG